jgi:hypothetical protein
MIDPSVRAMLRSRYSIRRFFSLFGLVLGAVLLLLAAISYAAPNGWFRDSTTNFLGNFAATVAGFILVYAFYVFVTSPGLRNAEVIPLRDVEISDEIINLVEQVSDYWFWGRSGSYFRCEVLPQLDEAAREARRHVHVRVVVPDPDREGNDLLYMNYRRGLGETADKNTLAASVIATIYSVAVASAKNPYLRAEIGLCPGVPVLRYDVSSSGALLTRDAKPLPAILVNSGNGYFEMFRDAAENELRQSRRLDWNPAEISAPDESEENSILPVLAAIQGLPHHNNEVIEATKQLLRARQHRYVR